MACGSRQQAFFDREPDPQVPGLHEGRDGVRNGRRLRRWRGPPCAVAMQPRHGLQQGAGVGPGGGAEQGLQGAAFHQPAVLHHIQAVAQLPDHAQVMGDQQQGGLLLLHAHQQLEDLRLHRHIQGRGRLVRDDQFRLHHQGHGDHHPLTLAAGQLVRIKTHPFRRVRQPHPR